MYMSHTHISRHVCAHLVFMKTLSGRCHYYPQFTGGGDWGTEGSVAKRLMPMRVGLGLEPGPHGSVERGPGHCARLCGLLVG